MEEARNSTAPLSLADTHHHDYLLEKERLPDLCPLNCNHKNCFVVGLKSKDLDDSSVRTSDENPENNSAATMSLWQSLVMFYIPFLLQPFWGGVDIVRSIFVTYVLEKLLKTDSWLDIKLYQSMSLSWPPALVFLAIVTVTALIIHPDGFTWIVLRKLRGSLVYLFESSTTCWAWVLNDFGAVVSTLLALLTFACLFFFCYLLHQTLRSRSNQKPDASTRSNATPTQEKSRRKRRKGKNDKSRAAKQHSNPPAEHSSPNTPPPTMPPPTMPPPTMPPPSVLVKHASDTSISESSSVDHGVSCSDTFEKESPLPALQENASAPKKEEKSVPEPPRLRVESLSTVDTTLMDTSFEDASVGSAMSGQSTPSQPVTPTESMARNPPARSSRARKTRGPQTARNATTSRNRKAERKHAPQVVSRWDALKPVNNSDQSLDGNVSKGVSWKNPRASHAGSSRNGKQPTLPKQKDSSSPVVTESEAAPPTSRVSMPSALLGTESFWLNNDATVVRTPERTALMTSFLNGSKNHGSSPPTTEAHVSSLNPNSPPFAPSQTVGLRPPPGLSPPAYAPPGFGNSNDMDPLHLTPAAPPGLQVPGLTLPSGSTSPSFFRPRENPFVDDYYDDEEQIAAELQELGGQMVGSILDF